MQLAIKMVGIWFPISAFVAIGFESGGGPLRRCRRLPSPEVTKGQIVDAVKNNDASTIPDIKRCTTADDGCGDCSLATGFSHRILKCTLKGMGKKALRASAPQFPSRTPNCAPPHASASGPHVSDLTECLLRILTERSCTTANVKLFAT